MIERKFGDIKPDLIGKVLFILIIIIGFSIAVVFYSRSNDFLLYYGDSVSRLVKSRLIIDSKENGFIQIGTAWLPLPYLLFLPFSLINFLFFSGFAGLVVNLPLHALASYFIYRISFEVTNNKYTSIISCLLFGFNPNMIYLAATAMSEPPFFAFYTGSLYFLIKWIRARSSFEKTYNNLKNFLWFYPTSVINDNTSRLRKENRIKYIVISSFFLMLATLTRYEAWLIVIPYSIILIIYGIKRKEKGKTLIKLLLAGLISFIGIILWMFWNYINWGDFLYFFRAEFYSTAWQAEHLGFREGLFHNWKNVLEIYEYMSGLLFGKTLLYIGIIGILFKLPRMSNIQSVIIYLFLLLPPLSTIMNLYSGNAVIKVWLNTRYVLMALPFLSIAAGNLLNLSGGKKIINIGICSVLLIYIFMPYTSMLQKPEESIITLVEARSGYYYDIAPETRVAGNYIRYNYDKGRILMLTGTSQAQRILISGNINLTNYEIAFKDSYIYNQFYTPEKYFSWIVISSSPDSDGKEFQEYWKANMEILLKSYSQVYSKKYFSIFKIRQTENRGNQDIPR